MGLEPGEIARRVFPNLPDVVRLPILDRCFAEEMAQLRQGSAADLLYPGVPQEMRTLAARYPLYVVSNCEVPYLAAFLDGTGLGPLIRDAECFGRTGRPKADNIRRIVHEHRLEAPVYVGDTGRDEAAAQEAGVRFIHAAYGFGHASAGACAVGSFSELTQLLLAP
jgi:phosphoglycolate phosphatase